MRKATLTGFALLFICIAGITIYSAMKKTRSVQRDIPTLLNFYYNYKDKNPLKAKEALDLILKQDPSNAIALHAKSAWYIQQGDTHSALIFLEDNHALHPQDGHIEMDLAKLYLTLNQKEQAKPILKKLLTSDNIDLKKKSTVLYEAIYPQETIETPSINNTSYIEPIHITTKQDLSPLYAKIQEIIKLQPNSARNYLHLIISMAPNEQEAYVTLGYLELQQNNSDVALHDFLKAFAIKADAQLAVQIAYIYAKKGDKKQALLFFNYGAAHGNQSLRKQSLNALAFLTAVPAQTPLNRNKTTTAQLATTNMGSSPFQILSKPYFSEFYSAPFYFSRFDLGVLPTISRAGITVNENHHTEAYVSWRRTKDNRSGTVQGLIIQNSISEIFEDNAAIYAAGLRTYLWPKIPLQTFVELGQAEDLVYRNRTTWRSDVRGGLVYYNAWGEKTSSTTALTFPWKWISTLYADTIYYSRYNNNIIATAWFRPGLRVATFQDASLDFYLANYLILDKNREFYNNIYSLGPGIAFQPSNRINIVLRMETLQGYYIPVNSPTPNPYRSKYYNNLAMAEVYFRF